MYIHSCREYVHCYEEEQCVVATTKFRGNHSTVYPETSIFRAISLVSRRLISTSGRLNGKGHQ